MKRSYGVRKTIWVLWLFLSAFILFAAQGSGKKAEVFVEPSSVRTGENAYLVIRFKDESGTPSLSSLPAVPGLRWLQGISQSRRISIINGKRSSLYELRIPFLAEKAAAYSIPEIRLSNDVRTARITFTVQENTYTLPASAAENHTGGKKNSSGKGGETLSLDQILSVHLALPGNRKFYYLGEEIPLDIYVNILQGIRAELSWPAIRFSNPGSAVLLDYRKQNPDNPNYAGVMRSIRTLQNRKYDSRRFATAFRVLTPGKMSVTAEEQAALYLPDERTSSGRRASSGDDFFDDFWGGSIFQPRRMVTRYLKSTPLTVEIRKLPSVPDGVFFTGLTGEWKCRVTLSAPPYKAGEPLTVSVHFEAGENRIVSASALSALRPPVIKSSSFRIYAPEVEKNSSGAVIRYVLIPPEVSDGKKINLEMGPWATFNPVTSTYVTTVLAKNIAVEKGSSVILPGNAMPVVLDSAAGESSVSEREKQKTLPEDVLYLKPRSGKNVELPLWKNALIGGFVLLFISIVFLLLMVIINLRRTLQENDPSYFRRAEAKKMKRPLLKKIADCSLENLPTECSGEIASFLAEARNLEPGADLEECAGALEGKNPELSRMLFKLASCAWVPDQKSALTESFRKDLLKHLGKICCFALLLLPLAMPGAVPEKISGVSAGLPEDNAGAMRAYDKGQFAAAAAYYKQQLRSSHISPQVLYNLGNCYYKMGKLPLALICYERALRLDSRDPDILENLNLVRRKLNLKERYRIGSPADTLPYLRDMLRMDEWLLMIFTGISMLFAAGGYFLLNGDTKSFRIITALGACWVLLSFWAFLAQGKSIYNPDQALVMKNDLKIYSLPSEEAGKVEMKLHAGEEVYIVERRMEWIRIRSGNAEGWVHACGIMPLWNTRSMQDLVSHPE